MSQTQRQLRLGAIIQGVSSNMSAWRHHSGRVRGGTPTAFDDFVDQVIPLLQARAYIVRNMKAKRCVCI